MKQDYSFKKTIGKGIMALIGVIITFVSFTGFSDVVLWDLVVQYIKPIFGTMTVMGVLVMAKNFVKYNFLD